MCKTKLNGSYTLSIWSIVNNVKLGMNQNLLEQQHGYRNWGTANNEDLYQPTVEYKFKNKVTSDLALLFSV